jgi:hypothetical protein
MSKTKINVTVLKEDIGYSATANVSNMFIATEGDHFDELQSNLLEAINLAAEDMGLTYELHELQFEYDLASFFAFYNVINAKALSERIGMNQSLLAQYIKGKKKPSIAQTKRILDGVKQIGRELSEVNLVI